ncbi:hypothetical protein CcaverHIS002_0202230 [Cutaneotrichosporon cavernicola]|uniref:Cytoplasmic tRNA 2-thiolation protein 2 n=1 Tax=Cutaneotrichosporon cavernicola TaxID=279322 RepID=A0AA48KY03_9TREE|nr:uncharacterized protein CcaverHIS019_0202260 [Cutaneotrichosporon cavernicola]BEI81063.1 hypothetical protein CcaverHIS002_0202230 [Cutaneotrichosporon cavernicola]BEI88864.1 hypothetical protein CcaverHIS019_0202260 [Cutaneotrichosporon cavernicola]BEI96640.1 hypothetical protein CcaverHIS631_0202290 [Cutaneotrichosporon cavernicola]BEJ04413.1 hypothetical protein CcaverHIS641_0202300 [Cutaneotrichosporon cavernicola]
MCEVQETMPRPRRPRGGQGCSRCGGRAQYLIRDLLFCRPCFTKHIHHRLGRTINGPLAGSSRPNITSRPPPQTGGALIALSGGAGSTALLDFLVERRYLGPQATERVPAVWAQAFAVHVVFPGQSVGGLKELAESRGITYLQVRAEDVFDSSLADKVAGLVQGIPSEDNEDNAARLSALVASLPLPSRPTILGHILDAVLATVASALPVSHLILGETATREAQRVITGTAQGRGFSLPLDLVTLSSRALGEVGASGEVGALGASGVMRLRGARELSVKEAALYCHAKGLETFNYRQWGRKSIEGLTERFVATLSTRHPATVGAITRTAGKLQFTGQEGEGQEGPLCPLCRRPADPGIKEWQARASLTVLPGHPSTTKEEGALESLLCYGCAAALKGRKDAEMPPFVAAEVRRRVPESEMRAAIADYFV